MNRAFSLVELSIVLVILGLLTGGILAGQSLIRAAELRTVSSDAQRYRAAVIAFRDKYFALPGDLSIATKFWGVLNATPATCKTTDATGTATCDGDGNGFIDSSTGSYEYLRAWQHLANAGLIEGQYTGYSYASSTMTPGLNVPASKLSQAVWYISPNTVYYPGNAFNYAGDWGNVLTFSQVGYGKTIAGSGPLTPEQAWNIDMKMDDGLPGSGTIYASKGNATNTICTTAANVSPPTDAGSTYRLDLTSKDCVLLFLRAFN